MLTELISIFPPEQRKQTVGVVDCLCQLELEHGLVEVDPNNSSTLMMALVLKQFESTMCTVLNEPLLSS